MGRVVHFEIGTDDLDRAIKFYKIFGWDIKDAGMPDGKYWLATTGPDKDRGINGALMPRSYSPQPFRLVISVEDLEAAIKEVEAAGGKIDGDRQEIPEVGSYINIKDTEGNQIGLLQPRM